MTSSTVFPFYIHADTESKSKEIGIFLKNLKGKKILDACCGEGNDAAYLAQIGNKVAAVDIAKQKIELAQRKFEGIQNLKFWRIDILNLSSQFQKEKFDGIWFSNSFQHFTKSNAVRVLNILYKLLKKEGIIQISLKISKKENSKRSLLVDYTDLEIRKMLINARFTIIGRYKENEMSSWQSITAQK